MNNPTQTILGMAKHVLRYLNYSKLYELKFVKTNSPLSLIGYSDSDWGASNDRCSISGYCFKLNENSGLISWKSKKQNVVALSSCESEYISITLAAQEAKFLRQLFADMQNFKYDIVTLYVDNQGAIALAKNPMYHQRSKHIDIKYHFIRSEIEKKVIELKYVPSEQNLADIFTKALSKAKFINFDSARGFPN